MDCSPPGSSIHEVFQARVLQWVAISFSRGSSRPRDRTQVSCLAGRCFIIWATSDLAMTNLDSILKNRDNTWWTKVHPVKAMFFSVVIYGCESWTIKKAEHWRTDAFELWCWRRFLRVPWTSRRSNQSILKEISPEYFLVGLMLKLKPQYFGHLMQRTDSLAKTLMLGKTEGRRRRGWQDEIVGWHYWLNGYEFQQALGVGFRQIWTWLSNWTDYS